MAKAGGEGRGAKQGTRKKAARKGKAPGLPIGRPARLAHLVPGSDRQRKRERGMEVSTELVPAVASPQPRNLTPALEGPPQPGVTSDILCLPSPEWLPHGLTVSGPVADLAAFRRAATGPGVIPWIVDYDRLEEDWFNALLTPSPAERGISVEGARILAGQVRERIEQQDQRAAEAALGNRACSLDLHALVPLPSRILRLGPDDPMTIAWLWENWTTSWALRGVEEIELDPGMTLPEDYDAVRFRFWSADWAPWNALRAICSRWPSISVQMSVRAISE